MLYVEAVIEFIKDEIEKAVRENLTPCPPSLNKEGGTENLGSPFSQRTKKSYLVPLPSQGTANREFEDCQTCRGC